VELIIFLVYSFENALENKNYIILFLYLLVIRSIVSKKVIIQRGILIRSYNTNKVYKKCLKNKSLLTLEAIY